MSCAARSCTRRFPLLHIVVPGLAMATVLGLVYATDADRTLIAPHFDSVSRSFPLRHDYLAERILHRAAQRTAVAFEVGLVLTFLLSFRLDALKTARRAMVFLFLALMLGPAAVNGLKQASNQYCPSDLREYGGDRIQPRLFEAPAPGVKKGVCWPSGHAAIGFSFMALYFVLYRLGRRRAAAAALVFGLACGLALGYVRIVQGAHFLSHNLWSAAVCWTVIVTLYAIVFASDRRPVHFAASAGAFDCPMSQRA